MKQISILFCLLLVGCLQSANGPDYVPPFPPQPNPQPAPYEPVGNVRATISASLQGASREDCLTVYGIYSAAARYVQSDQLDASDSVELRKQIKKVLARFAAGLLGDIPLSVRRLLRRPILF